MIEIIPAILTNSSSDLKQKISQIDNENMDVPLTKRVQIDIVDGVFADNKTIDPTAVGGIDTYLGIDFHLMVKEPINWVEKCVNSGADRIIGQIEMMRNQREFIEKVQLTGLRVGLAIDLSTPVDSIDLEIITDLDVILVMSVKAGFGGQKFDKSVIDKIAELNEIKLRDKTPFRICVDGGETEDVIEFTHLAGADEVVIGNRIFEGDLNNNIKELEEAAHGG